MSIAFPLDWPLGIILLGEVLAELGGHNHAGSRHMVARKFEDLIVWQLAYQLKREVFSFTASGRAAQDFKFCDQIRESSRSATRNIAEGFGRYYPKEFTRFLRIAAGSLNETKDHLREALDNGTHRIH